jgi:CheY-like chemotaxis protein
MPSPHSPDLALLGSDLLMASRLRAVAAGLGLAVVQAQGVGALPDARWVFVDLNQRVDERIEAIGHIRLRRPAPVVVGFCDHDEQQVRRRAMEAGASQVVANRHLQEAAVRLIGAGSAADG